ncbi:MAG: hypothetical protein H6621_05610 [Halobacteriovoraceae bacterium]|nr:hypothetical protein [Halobacteriovoraceae bacterium]
MSENKGIFLNGKNQAIEILRHLNQSEKGRILDNLKLRNPSMAYELLVNSYTFEDIMHSEQNTLGTVLEYASAPIIGIAIKFLSKDFQKKILKNMNRVKAEEAFQVFQTRNTSIDESTKAQEKILEIASELIKRKIITL